MIILGWHILPFNIGNNIIRKVCTVTETQLTRQGFSQLQILHAIKVQTPHVVCMQMDLFNC